MHIVITLGKSQAARWLANGHDTSNNGMTLLCAEGAAAGKSAYIRYVVPTPDDEEATVEYDLDEEDEEWLQKHNHKVQRELHVYRLQLSSFSSLPRMCHSCQFVGHAAACQCGRCLNTPISGTFTSRLRLH